MRRLLSFPALGLMVLAGAAPTAPIEPAGRRLSSFPDTTVTYYDVAGSSVTAINRSIRAQRSTGPNGKVRPASTSWSVTADFEREIVGGRCSIRSAQAEMSARAELPRLVDGAGLTPSERTRWAEYVALLEQGSAATLAFVAQNLRQIETAIENSTCDGARNAATAAVELLRSHANKVTADNEKRLAALSEFRPVMLTDSKLVCRDLKVTGGRLQTVRSCLPKSEWERLWKSSAAFTHDLVAKSSKLPRTPF